MSDFPQPIPGARALWGLDPSVCFLNHGSFGATPKSVLAVQSEWRARMEREPVLFLHREIEGLLDSARESVARFVGADVEGFSFVPNATVGVNTVLRSLRLAPGDEILVTDQGYNACTNAAYEVAERAGARVVVASIPWPCSDPDEVTACILDAVTHRTRVLIADHVTSPTGVIWPIDRIVRAAKTRNVPVLVDGAHAPGMLALDLLELDAAWYTGNLHKWCCAPKGAAFLWVHPSQRETTVPLAVSHGRNSARTDRSKHRLLFDWTGTFDPTAWLAAPAAIECVGGLLPGGWPALRDLLRRTALAARVAVAKRFGTAPTCPDSMIGFMAAVEISEPAPDSPVRDVRPAAPLFLHPLQTVLWRDYRIEIPVTPFPDGRRWNLRLSAAPHNIPDDYARLVAALGALGYGGR